MDYLLTNSTFKEIPTQITSYYIRMFLNYHSQLATQYGMELDAYAQAKATPMPTRCWRIPTITLSIWPSRICLSGHCGAAGHHPHTGADRQRQQLLRRHLRRTAQHAERLAVGGAGQGGGKRSAFLTVRRKTILNGFRYALAIFSGKIIFNRAMPERLRTLRHCIFTGGGATENCICSAAFCESAARRGKDFCRLSAGWTPSVKA